MTYMCVYLLVYLNTTGMLCLKIGMGCSGEAALGSRVQGAVTDTF